MRIYKQTDRFYVNADLHSRFLYLCIVDQDGNTHLHQESRCHVDRLEGAMQRYRDGLDLDCKTAFSWYWLRMTVEIEAPFIQTLPSVALFPGVCGIRRELRRPR